MGTFTRHSAGLLYLTFALSALMSWGQTPTAQITGRITDKSRSVIPGARVTATNIETLVRTETTSNDVGYYVIPLLPTGEYGIEVQREGFRSAMQDRILLTVDRIARIDIELEVGAVSERIEVAAVAPMLERDTSTVGTLVDSKRVEELPLQGRNAYALVELIPGARVPVSWQDLPMDMNNTQFVMINGARGSQNEFLLDGIPNTNARTGGPGVFPNPDSVQEFRVETNTYSAEYGRAAGGVFNVVTRSGTNRFHGSAWDFLRNSKLNANNFFSNRAGQAKPPLTFNQFGLSAGGPIRKNKTFFFTSWESARTREGVLWVGHVPTAAERAGNFSGVRNAAGQLVTVYDPNTIREDPARAGQRIRDPFPGNTMPRDRLNKISLGLQDFLPVANTSGANYTYVDNYVSANPIKTDKDTFMVKIDNHFSDKYRISGSLHLDHSPWTRANAYGNEGTPTYGPQLFQRRGVVMDQVYVLNPTTILNLRYGLS
ncbi:MAG: carboxypeptidase regulatory-like domain-containing protein, partial [Acidobacteria bacterium]|nr:carboxypeptidase regulatory-like domain-containing protein [Acidobacteriota bacterium]